MSTTYYDIATIKTTYLSIVGSACTLSDSLLTLLRSTFITCIEQDCQVKFEPVQEVRNFSGRGGHQLVVDPYVSVTGITATGIGGVGPLTLTNWIEHSSGAAPKTEILFPHNFQTMFYPYIDFSLNYFPVGTDNIAVNANWGWSANVPDPIQLGLVMYVIQCANTFSTQTLNQFKGMAWKEVEESDRRVAFAILDPQNMLPSQMNYRGLVRRFKITNKTRRSRTVLL